MLENRNNYILEIVDPSLQPRGISKRAEKSFNLDI